MQGTRISGRRTEKARWRRWLVGALRPDRRERTRLKIPPAPILAREPHV